MHNLFIAIHTMIVINILLVRVGQRGMFWDVGSISEYFTAAIVDPFTSDESQNA